MIKRDNTKIPKPGLNPAAGVIEDTIQHHSLSQAEVARAMSIRPSLLNEIIKNKRGVSAEVALRFQHCFGFSAKSLMALQADHDFRRAYHAKFKQLKKEVKPIAHLA